MKTNIYALIFLALAILTTPLALANSQQYQETYFLEQGQIIVYDPLTHNITKTITHPHGATYEFSNIQRLTNSNYITETIAYNGRSMVQRINLHNSNGIYIDHFQAATSAQFGGSHPNAYINFDRLNQRSIIETDKYILIRRISEASGAANSEFQNTENYIYLNKEDLTQITQISTNVYTGSRSKDLYSLKNNLLSVGQGSGSTMPTTSLHVNFYEPILTPNSNQALREENHIITTSGTLRKTSVNTYDETLFVLSGNRVTSYDLTNAEDLPLLNIYAETNIEILDMQTYNNKEGAVIIARNNVDNFTALFEIDRNAQFNTNLLGLIHDSNNHKLSINNRDEIIHVYTPAALGNDVITIVNPQITTNTLENLPSEINLSETIKIKNNIITRINDGQTFLTKEELNYLDFSSATCEGCEIDFINQPQNKKVFLDVQTQAPFITSIFNFYNTAPDNDYNAKIICNLNDETNFNFGNQNNNFELTEITLDINYTTLIEYELNGVNFNLQNIDQEYFFLIDSEIVFSYFGEDLTNQTLTIKHGMNSDSIQTKLILPQQQHTLISISNPSNTAFESFTTNTESMFLNKSVRDLSNNRELNIQSPRNPFKFYRENIATCTYTSTGTKNIRSFAAPINSKIYDNYKNNPFETYQYFNVLDFEEYEIEITTSSSGSLPETPDPETGETPNGTGNGNEETPNGESRNIIDWLFSLLPDKEELGSAKALFYAIIWTLIVMGMGYYATQHQQESRSNSTLTLIITGVFMILSIVFFTLIGYIPVWVIIFAIIISFYFFAKPYINTER